MTLAAGAAEVRAATVARAGMGPRQSGFGEAFSSSELSPAAWSVAPAQPGAAVPKEHIGWPFPVATGAVKDMGWACSRSRLSYRPMWHPQNSVPLPSAVHKRPLAPHSVQGDRPLSKT